MADRVVSAKRATRTARRTRTPRTGTDRWAASAVLWSMVLVVLLGLAPQILVGIVGVVTGEIPPGGVLDHSDAYPFFQPPFWLLWIPALLMLAAAVLTMRPGKPAPLLLFPARWELAILAFVGLCITATCAGAYGGPQLMVVLWACVPWLLAVVLLAVRGAWELAREAWSLWRPGKRR